jgi:hypothetical protein
VRDEAFGYVLHPIDLAINKVGAAYGRREVRDIVDLLTAHERILSLGATIWASPGKALGFTPEGIIDEIRRNARYTDADFRRVASHPPIDPTEKVGLLFLQGGQAVQPDPERLDEYDTHAGRNRGHWPSSSEITAAMFEPYRNIDP